MLEGVKTPRIPGDDGAPALVEAGPETRALGRGDRRGRPGDRAQRAKANLAQLPADPPRDDEGDEQAIMAAVKARVHNS